MAARLAGAIVSASGRPTVRSGRSPSMGPPLRRHPRQHQPRIALHELGYVAGVRMLNRHRAEFPKTSNYVAMTEAAQASAPIRGGGFVIGESLTGLPAHADEVTGRGAAQVAATLDMRTNPDQHPQYTSAQTGFPRARRCRTATSSTVIRWRGLPPTERTGISLVLLPPLLDGLWQPCGHLASSLVIPAPGFDPAPH